MAKSPTRTMMTRNTVVVHRAGKNIHVAPGKAFAFTDDEVDEIRGHSPDALRTPTSDVNPSAVVVEDETETDDPAKTVKAPKGKGRAPVTEDDEAL